MCDSAGDVPDDFEATADDERNAEPSSTSCKEEGVVASYREEEDEEDNGGWD